MFTILYFIFKTASQNKQQIGSGEIADQFTNLSKIGFYMECFVADVLQFLTEKPQHVALGGRLVTSHRIQQFQGFC